MIAHRRSVERWPAGLALDAPITQMTDHLDWALDGIALPQSFILSVQGIHAGRGMRPARSAPAEEAAPRPTRDRLAKATGLEMPHITATCSTSPWPISCAGWRSRPVQALSAAPLARQVDALRRTSLGPPELCCVSHHAPA
ncbi:MAG: DUF1868 domain-containing protein [Pseudomonadota bacterium]